MIEVAGGILLALLVLVLFFGLLSAIGDDFDTGRRAKQAQKEKENSFSEQWKRPELREQLLRQLEEERRKEAEQKEEEEMRRKYRKEVDERLARREEDKQRKEMEELRARLAEERRQAKDG
jgi:predicted Holliday junction resolvase-like endonuclease